MAIELTSIQDLCCLCQDFEKSDTSDDKVVRTAFAAIDGDDNAYFGYKLGITISELSVDHVRECIKPLPNEEVYPQLLDGEGLTVAPDDVTGLYVKRPAWAIYLDVKGTDFMARSLLQEAHIMEFLAKCPHPNIVRYHGCRVKGGRITGLALDTFEFAHDLAFAKLRPDLYKGRLDRDLIISGVRSAIDHLHSLRVAHNDLNPANIMIGDGGANTHRLWPVPAVWQAPHVDWDAWVVRWRVQHVG